MEQSSEEGLARLARELRGKLEATQPAAYCSQGIAPAVARDVAQRLYEIASEAMRRFDVVGTTEHMRNLCIQHGQSAAFPPFPCHRPTACCCPVARPALGS